MDSPEKDNHLHQGIHQKRTGECLRVNYKKNVSKPILVWLHPIQTTKKWLWVGSSNGKPFQLQLAPQGTDTQSSTIVHIFDGFLGWSYHLSSGKHASLEIVAIFGKIGPSFEDSVDCNTWFT